MDVSEPNVQVTDNNTADFLSVYIKQEHDDRENEFNDIKTIAAAQHLCAIEIKEIHERYDNHENGAFSVNNENDTHDVNNPGTVDANLDAIQHRETCVIDNVLTNSIYLGNLDSESTSEIQRQANKISQAFFEEEQVQTNNSVVSTNAVPNEFLRNVNLSIKKENRTDIAELYSSVWLNNVNSDVDLQDFEGDKCRLQISSDVEATITPIGKSKCQPSNGNININEDVHQNSKRRTRSKSITLLNYQERLKKKAECMREKRRKLYQKESEEERLQRLAKEAAKRRETRMYYESPEQRRQRLDTEAARKREYRMYNETPEDRRKRLDREAERRRLKRLSLYARETPEQRRERLDRESAKRREARLSQYAKETDEQRKTRLKREALRAREIRFTKSAIETEEERAQRLVKEALRKKEVRMHRYRSSSDSLTELRTVRNFEELNNVQMKDNPDSLVEGHYLSNWVIWLQNSLVQPAYHAEEFSETQSGNDG